jgi:NAD(P)-dependent dehydrogenase (short-subunit alcohol dehydrogenase family)
LVTGAAVRIGRAIALALGDLGMGIVVHYRRSEAEAAQPCQDLAKRGVRAWTVQGDFSDPADAERVVERALAAAGALDVLVNNASMVPRDALDVRTLDGLVENLRVNAWAPFAASRAFARRSGRGHIVNLLDSRIDDMDWHHVGYVLSKHVLAAMTRMMALAFAPDIAVNAVAPGLILPPPGAPHDYIDALVQTVPLAQHGEPEQIARAVAYLATSEFITGEVIYVDGGRYLEEYNGDGPHRDHGSTRALHPRYQTRTRRARSISTCCSTTASRRTRASRSERSSRGRSWSSIPR